MRTYRNVSRLRSRRALSEARALIRISKGNILGIRPETEHPGARVIGDLVILTDGCVRGEHGDIGADMQHHAVRPRIDARDLMAVVIAFRDDIDLATPRNTARRRKRCRRQARLGIPVRRAIRTNQRTPSWFDNWTVEITALRIGGACARVEPGPGRTRSK